MPLSIKSLTDSMASALKRYVRYRQAANPDSISKYLVGQYIDKKGAESGQFGLYGISSWLLLSRKLGNEYESIDKCCLYALIYSFLSTKEDYNTDLVDTLKTQFSECVDDSLPLNMQESYGKFPRQLKTNLCKLLYAFRALQSRNDLITGVEDPYYAAVKAAKNLLTRQHDRELVSCFDLSAEGNTSSKSDKNILAQSLLLRHLIHNRYDQNQINKLIEDLVAETEGNGGSSKLEPLGNIFTLSSLLHADNGILNDTTKSNLIDNINKNITKIEKKHVTQVENPKIIHFYIADSIKYIRYPSDLIRLEGALRTGRIDDNSITLKSLEDWSNKILNADEKDEGPLLSITDMLYLSDILHDLSKEVDHVLGSNGIEIETINPNQDGTTDKSKPHPHINQITNIHVGGFLDKLLENYFDTAIKKVFAVIIGLIFAALILLGPHVLESLQAPPPSSTNTSNKSTETK